MGVRAVEEAEGGLEEACRELPCGDGSDGGVVREARRAWAKRSSSEGSGVEEARREEGEKWGPRPWGESRGESRGRGLEIG